MFHDNRKMNCFNNICRICMQEDNNTLINLFSPDEDFVEINTKLYFCIPTVEIDDKKFPQQVCAVCVAELRLAYQFKNKCLRSTRKIKNILNGNEYDQNPEKQTNVVVNNINLKQINEWTDKINVEEPIQNKKNTKSNLSYEENESNESDNNDILIDQYQNNIEETYDDDHCYFLKNNEIVHKNKRKKSVETGASLKVKLEEDANVLVNSTIEEQLRESVFNPIFSDLALENENYDANKIIKIEKVDNILEDQYENAIEDDPIYLQPNQIHSNIPKILNKIDNPAKFQYYCTLCNLGFEDNLLKEHSEIHQNIEIISCPSCKRQFNSININLFFRHYCPQHNRPFMLTCTICYRKLKNSQALANHAKIHDEKSKPSFCCDICDLSFPTIQKRDWHMRNGIHTDKVTKKLKRF